MAALVLLAVLLFPGCASIVSKSTYSLSVACNPVDTRLSITDKKGTEIYQGNTPASVKLKAGSKFFSRAEYQVKLSSPGYDDKVIPVQFKVDGWYWGNILFGGLIGMLIVDPATGAMYKIDTENISETLVKSGTASVDPELKIIDIRDIPESWKARMVKMN